MEKTAQAAGNRPSQNQKKTIDKIAADDRSLRVRSHKAANEIIRLMDFRCRDHGWLPADFMLEDAIRHISEKLALAKGTSISVDAVTKYILRRSDQKEIHYLFQKKETQDIIYEKLRQVSRLINYKPLSYRPTTGEKIGRDLKLTAEERDKYRVFTMIAIDQSRAELKTLRKDLNRITSRACKAKKRRLAGAKMRCDSDARLKPWEKLGISRKTWYKRGKPSPNGPKPTAEIIQLHPGMTSGQNGKIQLHPGKNGGVTISAVTSLSSL